MVWRWPRVIRKIVVALLIIVAAGTIGFFVWFGLVLPRDWRFFSGPLAPGTLGRGGERFDEGTGLPGGAT